MSKAEMARTVVEKRKRGIVSRSAAVALACAACLGILLALSGCTLWTVRSLHPAEGETPSGGTEPGQPGFSAPAYVDSIWESKVVPEAQNKSTDLKTLLDALRANPDAAKEQYGHREGQREAAWPRP